MTPGVNYFVVSAPSYIIVTELSRTEVIVMLIVTEPQTASKYIYSITGTFFKI